MKKANHRKSGIKKNSKPEVKKKLRKSPLKKIRKKNSKEKILADSADIAVLSAQKGITLVQEQPSCEELAIVPERYNENILTLMVRDPWWVFAYWDYTQESLSSVLLRVRNDGQDPKNLVIRVYEVSCRSIEEKAPFFDIEITSSIFSWHIDTGKPGESWQLEIGFRTALGDFYSFLRSNVATTPSVGLSDCLDGASGILAEESYRKIIQISMDPQASSLNSVKVREYYERYMKSVLSSDGGRAKR